MRTTVDVDDDVLLAVKERARREHRSAGAVLSELARQALTTSAPARSAAVRHGFSPLPHRGELVTNALIDSLLEEE
jgi:hypothetical protein